MSFVIELGGGAACPIEVLVCSDDTMGGGIDGSYDRWMAMGGIWERILE